TLKTPEEIRVNPLGLPRNPTFENYAEVIADPMLLTAFLNTAYVTLATVVLTLAVGSLAAFAVTMRSSWVTRAVGAALLVAFLVPYQTTLLPLYRFMAGLGLVDHLSGLVAVYSSGAVLCYFVIVGYMRGLPREL